MTRKTATRALVMSMLLAALFGVSRSAPARAGCTDAMLRGSYGIDASGSIASGPLAGPTAFVGVVTYDGVGGVAGDLTQRVTTATGPITLTKIPIAGTYTVNPDCTIEDSVTNLTNGATSTHEAVLVDGGRSFVILNTTAGPTVIIGHGRKQFAGGDDPE